MEFFNSRKFILLLVLVMVVLMFNSCAKKHVEKDHPKQPTTLETIGKLDAIANVLGCMFDPTPCQERKKEEKDLKFEVQE